MAEKRLNIRMTRVLVHNWAGFEKEIMSLGEVTQIIGANGSGKSTIIDALNLVWSGAKRLNEAASGNNYGNTRERTVATAIHAVDLTNDVVRRPRNVTAYVIIEYYNQATKSSFLNGIQLHSKRYEGKDTSVTEIYFSFANAKLEEMLDFVYDTTNTKLSSFAMMHKTRFATYPSKDAAFKSFLRQRGMQNVRRIDFEKKVNRILGVKMTGNDGRKISVDEFVKSYVLTEGLSDGFGDMSSFKEQYEFLTSFKEELKQKEEQVSILEDIAKNVKGCLNSKSKQAYIKSAEYVLEIDENERTIERKERDKQDSENELHRINDEIFDLDKEIKSREDEIKSIEFEMASSIQSVEKDHKEAIKKVDALEKEKDKYNKIIEALQSLKMYGLYYDEEVSENFIRELNKKLDQIIDEEKEEVRNLKAAINDKRSTLKDIKDQEERLSNGIAVHGNKAASDLKNAFNAKYKKNANLLYEMIDSIDPEWQQAIENFLGNRRFALLVEDAYISEALKLYRDYKGSIVARIKDSSLVEKKSAFGVIKVKDNDALATRYLKSLLQRVVLCDTEEELKAAIVGIMRDGRSSSATMYENRSVKDLTLVCGKEAIRRELERVQKEREILEYEVKSLNDEIYLKGKTISNKESANGTLKYYSGVNYNVLEELEKAKIEEKRLQERIDEIKSGSKNVSLQKEMEAKRNELEEFKNERSRLIENRGSEKAKANAAIQLINEAKNRIEKQKQKLINVEMTENDIREFIMKNGITNENSSERYHDEVDKESAYQKHADVSLNKYRRIDPRFDFETSDKGLKEIEKKIMDIKEVKYPEIRKAIDEHTQKMKESKKNFFTGIGENYRKALASVKSLNQSLGKTRYKGERIIIKLSDAENEYGRYLKAIRIVCLNEIATDEEKKWAEEELNRMVNKIIEKKSDACQKFADYRNFIKVEVSMEHENEETKETKIVPLQRYNSVASGGQEQTPLYMLLAVSMVSVFTEAGVRMIILDEAFSKMDRERTEYVLNFFKELNLQVIVSTYEQLNSESVDMTNLITKSQNGAGMKSVMAKYNEEIGKWVNVEEKNKEVENEEHITQVA